MPFDLSIIETDGRPSGSISLSPNEHHSIFGVLNSEGYRLLPRLRDYYADADFSHEEQPRLRAELETRICEVEVDSLNEKLRKIIELVDQAISDGKSVAGISD